MLAILTLLFILSGAAGLFYESVWSRYLGLFVGHSAYAQVIVLVIFLGGMAIGATIVGKLTTRIREPLFGYALVEAAVGLVGLFFQEIYVVVTGWAYAAVFPAMAGSMMLVVTKWSLAALLILPQSILLGATFPLMTAGALRRIPREPGRTLSVLYFANSFGAAGGVLVAGFYLIVKVGLPGTILAASILNFVVAIGAMATMRYTPGAAEPPDTAERQTPASGSLLAPSRLRRLLLWTALGTAVASFMYEIAWIRMLSLVLSSATHSFELMLSAFILGLALGSFWIRRRADRFADPLRTLAIVQICMGLLALATLPLYFQAFSWMGTFLQTFARSPDGYAGFNLARYGVCLLVMLPATFCAGITLPLITRTLVLGGVGERAIGQVYGWNTFGSIVGVAIGALVLLPLLGLKAVLSTGALLDIAVGLGILVAIRSASPTARRLALGAAVLWAVVAGVATLSPAFDQRLMLSGVYRFGVVPPKGSREILFYKDGRTATVSAERISQSGDVFVATNGKSDGAVPAYWMEPCEESKPKRPLSNDASTWTLATLITMAHRPAAEIGAVIGQGTGMTTHLLLGNPKLKDLYTIEIEPEMIRASKELYPANRRAFDDPRSHYVVDDAKSYFAAAGRSYDVIFSEPSNPWVSGVAGLFTAEFYARVRQYLRPGGIFAQWVHIYDINDRLVMTVLAAVQKEFVNYEVFMAAPTDMLIIASADAKVPRPDWSVFQYPDIARDLCHQIPLTSEALEATRLGNRRSLGPLVSKTLAINSDFYPHLDNGAERSRYLSEQASGIYGLSAERFDVTAPLIGRRVGPASFLEAPVLEIPRLRDLAQGALLRNPKSASSPGPTKDVDNRGAAIYRDRSWQALLASTEDPWSWRTWIQTMGDVERDRYGGTSGYADERFYAEIKRFLDRHHAPAEVRSVVEFRHGVAAWDFPRAAAAAEPLIAAALARSPWMPTDELREGATIARLATGNSAGAREVFLALAPLSRRPPGDFRAALIAAYIEAADSPSPPSPDQ